ncbi:glutamate receptor ionotropic, NMDA 3A-like [Oppia nitens]|uniref:glutamate receptor ionotropic, NMDA 3A-like n=1 Tax=Oppia nitens TaxID=1686743 RepID=UPI0023DB428F|nr:glutamate receptor ionotropic, NMDA 3A-like [Oppia nitens]
MSRESIFISTQQFLTSRIVLLILITSWICIHTNGNRYPPFQILAILPEEEAPQISRELRRALAEWEVTKHSALLTTSNNMPAISVSDISMFVSPIAVTNDSQRIMSSLCEALEVHNPSVILSLVSEPRSFYADIIAETTSLPFLSLTQQYRQELWLEQMFDTSKRISLDPPIWSLADAVYEMLKIQHWFDAILLIDDSVTSDMFSYRLSHLCKVNRNGQITNQVISANTFNNMYVDTKLWQKPMTILFPRGLKQRDFYLKMAEIQTSHRRIILVHCNRMTSARIVNTARSLGLLEGNKIWILLDGQIGSQEITSSSLRQFLDLPNGMIALRHRTQHHNDIKTLTAIIQLIGRTASSVYRNSRFWLNNNDNRNVSAPGVNCWHSISNNKKKFNEVVYRELKRWLTPLSTMKSNFLCKLRRHMISEESNDLLSLPEESLWSSPVFDILNLVPADTYVKDKEWKVIGNITKDNATINTIRYIGHTSDVFATGKHRFRIATNIAPPFVIGSTKLDNNSCLTGDFCLKVKTNIRDDLISIFTDFRSNKRQLEGQAYEVHCCAGISIDLLNAVARDLNFDYDLYLVADGLFGVRRNGQWDGITADLVNDVAHMSFTAFSTTSTRVQAIDYSVPFFYSGVSCLSRSSNYMDVPLEAFLIPFSYQLWFAIFMSLLATAVAAAIYEWLSPFGLNPWGRQRTKNFSLASALWVMCSLLFSHLVAFKAPKSWPNKVLINVWGAFSVIFLATYTANIAAHFAGLFLIPEVNDFRDSSLMKQRTGTARSSASEGYLMEKYTDLWHHIQRCNHCKVHNFTEGLEHLRNDDLDVLIGDTAILDYFRATDPSCNLKLLGDSIFDDAYAVGMQKGFPFRELISSLILKYNEYGFLDQLHRKWYGRVHCLESSALTKPKPLTVKAVAGVFLMLFFGLIVGTIILLIEHFFFKYFLPSLRKKPKDCFWKSPNLMFFSQKLYRFINTVELVSPHHSAKEIMTNLREGQIASLFQKSVKRKAKEEARRRKSKSQFFEMIQEVRKVVQRQQHERSFNDSIEITSKPSMVSNQSETIISETESLGAPTTYRTSSIRFKETDDIYDEHILVHREPLPPNLILKPVSSLKGSDSRTKLLKTSRTSTSMTSSGDSPLYKNLMSPLIRSNHRLIPNSMSSQFTTSFSLENVSFITTPEKQMDKSKTRRKMWSFDDLDAIKRELREPVSPHQRNHSSLLLFELIPKKNSVIIASPRHRIDNLRLSSMTKEDVLSMWRSSERELLNHLQEALHQKRALEERVALLQRMLMKPP